MTTKAEEFENLYLSESSRLKRQIFRRIGCAATAGDLVQEIFLRFWEKTTDLKGDAAAYLTRSARNAAIDHRRAEARRKRVLCDILPEQLAAPQATPLDVVIGRDEIRALDAIIADLPKQTRHIFLLNRIHGRSFAEIAGVFGISERAVAKHMARAIAACERTTLETI